MTAAKLDLAVQKGDRIVQVVLVTTNGVTVPLPSGTSAKMQIRRNHESVIILGELTPDNERILVEPDSAKVTITMPSAFTSSFEFERAVYDLKLIYPDNEEETIVAGKIYVLPSVTRS